MFRGSEGGQFQSSVNASSRGRQGTRGRGSNRGGRGRGTGGRNGGGRGGSNHDNKQGGSRRAPCHICKKTGHEARDCWYRYGEDDDEYQPKSAGVAAGYGIDTNWYAHSGATDHITSELEKMTVRDKYDGQDQVHTASGAGMKISNIRYSVLHTPSKNLHLKNILHVPSANKSLLSVHRLTSDNNAFLEFHLNYFLIKDRDTKAVLHHGRCERGLYPLVSHSSRPRPAKQAHGVNKPSSSRWHSRMGHPAYPVVQRILRDNNLPCASSFSNESVCDSCQKAKSHQLPYGRSDSVSSSPFELIFSDVWGPAPVSIGRNKYYVSFIDDFSKYIWVYLIKQKSDVFQVFKNFQNMVERKFNKKIVSMQTDWGGEYEKLNFFFQEIGIAHRVSCPHAHQQNGAAKRKHRHIVEIGLALLAHASMPLKFWDEAFLTAAYLINILPSRVINYSTPAELLLQQKPNYNSLRIFGCTCWPNLRHYNTHKLAFRSIRYVFLGYSSLHKGFKCLEPSTGRVYISRDVVFDENVFPFHDLHPDASARLHQEILLLPNHLLNPGDASSDSGVTNFKPAASTSSVLQDPKKNSAPNTCDEGVFVAPPPTSAIPGGYGRAIPTGFGLRTYRRAIPRGSFTRTQSSAAT
jgi:histone deacetylase 1/2